MPTKTDVSTPQLPKAPTGIAGLDEVTGGGLPRGRPTLVCGSAGCGKTLLSIEFLVRGATQFDEPGVFMAFEETAEELAANVASLGFDLEDLRARKKLIVDHVHIERSEIEETGAYDLEGLFLRLGHAIDTIGAKRVVLDTLETLFGSLSDENVLRAELRRLFRWLKERNVTAIITAERGGGTLTRHGIEEYVSDCVILLDHRVDEQVSTRRLRIVKYRGTTHGTNELPFLIDANGLSVLPLSSARLDHVAREERVPTGVARLDEMLGGEGYYAGSTVLVSGTAGTGKTSLAARFADATCASGGRCLYFAFEESPSQLVRNMRSVGTDLARWIDQGRLVVHAARPTLFGLEMHLATMHKAVREFRPDAVIIDPASNFIASGTRTEVKSMLVRMIDFLKSNGITAMFTHLTGGAGAQEATDAGLSSIVDTWLLLRDIELGGERNRALYVLKSRGMAHSNQIREFVLGPQGIELRDVYVGPEGVLTGSMRLAQEARERGASVLREQDIERRKRELERKRAAAAAQISALQSELAADEEEYRRCLEEAGDRQSELESDRQRMAKSRRAERDAAPKKSAPFRGGARR